MTLSPSAPRMRENYWSYIAVILLVALAAAYALFRPIQKERIEIYDEGSYYIAAREIRQSGVLTKYSWAHLHSYLYPSVLAYGVPSSLNVATTERRWPVFVLQAGLFFLAVLYVAWVLRQSFEAKRTLAMVGFLCLNPFTLIYLGYSLTDSFSLTVTLAFVASVAATFQQPAVLTAKRACVAGLLFGAAVMTRPANIYLLSLAVPAGLLHLYQGVRSGQARRTIPGCLVGIIAAGLVCLPQSLNRYRNFGNASPLILESGIGQFAAARTNLKYATYVGGDAPPWVNYRNPFYPDSAEGAVILWN